MRDKFFLIALGKHIRFLRVKKKLSQEDLANDADIPISQIGRIERGEINTTVSTIYTLSKALQVHYKDVLDFKIQDKRES